MTGIACAVYGLLLLTVCVKVSDSQSDYCNTTDYAVEAWIGDGSCDPQNLTPECDWDGGDCCSCTCVDDEFGCGTDGYVCINPDVLGDEITVCNKMLPPACSVETKRKWLVENTMQARALAEAVNCTGGTFEVEWSGNFVVETEFVVVDGTSLNITGMGSGGVVDGGGLTRLFRVVNASIQLNNMEVRNGNATFGGAVAAIGSTLSLNRTSFSCNTANDKNGGAMFVYGGAVSFHGDAKFVNNSSNNDGGALYVVNSTVSWEGVSSFSENSATVSGGALSVVSGSTAYWAAETTFRGNSAGSYSGGALYLESSSSASWRENVSFVENSAQSDGGAIFVNLESFASWDKGAHFSGNRATDGGGGAMLVADSSKVVWGGESFFTSNNAGTHGGAVSSRVLDSTDEESYLSINGTTIFANNSCGSNGGGLALLGGLSVSIQTDNMTFAGNKAAVSGGAVSISATGTGPVFTNANFLSNFAKIGGGVFIIGTATVLDAQDGDMSATFDSCRFIGNKAEATGGAIEISTGLTALTNISFTSNVAALGGGALWIAGATSLYDCVFEENLSDVNGSPAIMMVGFILDIQRCFFRSNAYDCDVGKYLDESSTGDRFAVVCSGCNPCDTCEMEIPEQVPTCLPAIGHSVSQGGNLVTLETLSIEAGYWRATNVSLTVLPCYNGDACAGGITGSSDYCKDGYTGPYCAVCTEKYSKGSGFTCTNCSDNVWGKAVAAVAAVVAAVIVVNAFAYMISVEKMATSRGLTSRLLRRVPLHSVKIIIVSWQILTQFTAVADVTYPDIYQRFLNVVDVLNFDPTWVLSAGCIADVDFHGRFLMVTIGPILIMLLLRGTYSYVVRRNDASREALQIARHKHVSAALFIMFLVYSFTSSMVFQMFDCDALDDGNDYLRADYTIQCHGPRHRALMIYAGFMILVYPLGIPVVFAILLFQNRGVLLDRVARSNESLRISSMSDLWEPYKPSRYYYEVIECGRRIVLMGVVMGVDDKSAAQIAVTLILAVVFMVMSEVLAPYESKFDAWVSRLGHAVVVFSMYFALLLKVDVSKDSQESQNVFEVMLIGIHAFMVLVVILEATLTGCSMHKDHVEGPWPIGRSCRSRRSRVGCRPSIEMSITIQRSLGDNTIERSSLVRDRSTVTPRSGGNFVAALPQLEPVPQRTELV